MVVDCGLDYGGDMLIMLHTLLHILLNFHDRRDATKDFQFRDEIIRYPYAIRTPFHTLFFFFQGNISLAERGVEKASGSSACFRF